MLYLVFLCSFLLIFNLFCFAFIMRKCLSRPMLLGICIVSFVISVLFPMHYVLCNPVIKEQVSVTALREKNSASLATDVIIHFVDTNLSERKIENPVEGKWAWWNSAYIWSESWELVGLDSTDTIVLEVPAGDNRAIVFSTGPRSGKVEISCMGISQIIDLYSEQEEILSVQIPSSKHNEYVKDILLRALAFAAASFLIMLMVATVSIILDKKTNWRMLLKWKYEAIVFLISLINIVVMGWYPDALGYPLAYYCMPYEGGFNSRGLIGALTSCINGPYVWEKKMANFVLVVLGLAYLFFSVLIVRLAKRESDWRMGFFWVLLYLLTPISFLPIYDDARPDLYLIILFIVSAILINRNRFIQLVLSICVVMILINETSSLFFVAPLLALLLYFFVKERDIGYLIAFISSATFTCIVTLWIISIDTDDLVPIEAFYDHMSLHTDIQLDHLAFSSEYRTENALVDVYATMWGNQLYDYGLMIHSLLLFVMIIPFLILFVILWKAIYFAILENVIYEKLMIHHAGKSVPLWVLKFLFWIMLLSSFCGATVCILMAVDYFRFIMFIMVASMALMFTLIRKERLTLQIEDLYLFTPPKRGIPILPFAVLLYMNAWGTVNAWAYNVPIFLNLSKILSGFFGILK